MTRTAVIAGVGPGLGESLAERFAAEGYAVGLLARSESYLDDLAERIDEQSPGTALAVPTDLADPLTIDAAFEEVRESLGAVDVLVNHASAATWEGVREQDAETFRRALAVGPEAALHCSKAVVDEMATGDGGTIIFTGATTSQRGREGALGFSAAKFACRGMAQSMARELGPEGIHVAHVVIDGQILPPDGVPDNRDPVSFLDPDAIANSYWSLVEQDVETMTHEVHVTNGTQSIEFL
ncbi:MAG: NAD(P)-dependent dehydrogenase (short-subunit alcohol dehydrogenase family) [Natronomonas sp.]|jgi:NAD(P)-dependent dehydrogenase (short-subunit alcohol dehydrogenase family)|uniref:SDR family NAD(P)-dependent oxidoreductase n=1 Tax=Natronomonas sp. TaxID=2184060 RepID=UPI0039892FA2